MSIRRDLLLRTALLRVPEVLEMRDARPAPPAKETPPPRRMAPRRAGRRPVAKG